MMKILAKIIFIFLIVSCTNTDEKKVKKGEEIIPIIKEKYETYWNEETNIDSPTFWSNGDGTKNLLIATSKSRHSLFVYDAVNGMFAKEVGKEGNGELEFSRPNGIWVIDDLIFIVERDNHRIQVLELPEFTFKGFIGNDDLKRPYGISVDKLDNKKYRIYVTDNYETENEEVPADDLLGERFLSYELDLSTSFNSELIKKHGETSGSGVLKVVESVFADPVNNNLLLSEEDITTYIKVYDLDGNYKKIDIGKGLFKYQAEGIALYDKGNGEGYWFLTDQDHYNNTFHVFDRQTFDYKTSFKSKITQNTDGVWLTQKSFDGFPNGAFFVVNDDGGVGAYDLGELMNELKLD